MARILVVDDEANICWALKADLTAEGYSVDVAGNSHEALELLKKSPPDLLLCDIRLPGMTGIQILERFRAAAPGVPVILMTAYGSLDAAVDAMRKGAFEYLHKPLDLDQVKKTIGRALSNREAAIVPSASPAAGADREGAEPFQLVGRSVAMQEVFKLIGLVSQNDVTVLIEGESGVGKEQVARAIHRYSPRRDGPFVAVECGAFPDLLLEAELFGYDRGAAPGATGEKPGCFELAHTGTLFLGEVSELSLPQQNRVLRVLQDGRVERLGGHQAIPVDVRVIAASNRSLREAVTAKRFRDDLYFRLQVVTIPVPPLRQRKEDLYDLTAYFVNLAAREARRDLRGVQRDAMDAMLRYEWPGNLRELVSVIRRAAVLTRSGVIGLADLPPEISAAKDKDEPEGIAGLKAAAEAELRARLQEAGRGDSSIYHDLVGTVEASLVQAALAITGGNQVRAAELLGVNRTTLRKRLQAGQTPEAESD